MLNIDGIVKEIKEQETKDDLVRYLEIIIDLVKKENTNSKDSQYKRVK